MYHPLNRTSPQRRYLAARGFARAMRHLVSLMSAGASAADVAAFVQRQRVGTHVRLSHAIEDQAVDGTFAAAVFDILCNG